MQFESVKSLESQEMRKVHFYTLLRPKLAGNLIFKTVFSRFSTGFWGLLWPLEPRKKTSIRYITQPRPMIVCLFDFEWTLLRPHWTNELTQFDQWLEPIQPLV